MKQETVKVIGVVCYSTYQFKNWKELIIETSPKVNEFKPILHREDLRGRKFDQFIYLKGWDKGINNIEEYKLQIESRLII